MQTVELRNTRSTLVDWMVGVAGGWAEICDLWILKKGNRLETNNCNRVTFFIPTRSMMSLSLKYKDTFFWKRANIFDSVTNVTCVDILHGNTVEF